MNREEVAKALDALGVTVTMADDPVDGSRIEVVHLDDLARIGAVFEQVHTPTDNEREALGTLAEPENTLRDAADRVAGWLHVLPEVSPTGAMSLQADDLRRLVDHARTEEGEP